MPATAKRSQERKKPAPTGKARTNVSNVVTLDPNNPIPFEYAGEAFAYVNNAKFIPFLFPKNNFFDTLLEAKMLSATHTACIETKKNYCAGRGLFDQEGKDFGQPVLDWLKSINAKNESADKVNRKFFGSHFTFGNTPLEVVRFTVAGKKMMYIYAHNVREWRKGAPESDGIIRSAIMSKLFLKQGVITADALKNSMTLPIYDPRMPNSAKNWWTDPTGAQRTLFWLQNDMEGYDYYGMPSAVASLAYQIAEYKGIRYNIDNFENNMVLSAILALKGNLSQEEANKIGKEIIKTHTGDGRRGRVAVVSSEEGIDSSEFHQMQTAQDGSYMLLDDKLMAKIIMAHEWHPMLAGIDHGGALGKGNTFLRTIYEIKKKTVIDPAKQFLLDNFWQHVQVIAKIWFGAGFGFDKYSLGIKDVDPISIISDVDPSSAIKVDEVRKALDLDPLEDKKKGQLLMGEIVPPKPSPQVGQGTV